VIAPITAQSAPDRRPSYPGSNAADTTVGFRPPERCEILAQSAL